MSSRKGGSKSTGFSVGPAAKRELRRTLVRSTDPAGTIQKFQREHSLHSMMARAFGTAPRHEESTDNQESLDTDSVMTFLSHLGLTQFEVHKRISDTLLKQLEDEIRKTKSEQPLLDLLKSCWSYVTTLPELRPILWSVLKQLGDRTPLAVLKALAERGKEGKLKHADIFRPLPALLKRLCWEADWDSRIPVEPDTPPKEYLKWVESTLLYETLLPHVQEYCNNTQLVQAANQPFVVTMRERRMVTTQRRALTATQQQQQQQQQSTTTSSLLRGTKQSSSTNMLTSGKSVAQLRALLSDTVGTALNYRPMLLYALLSILMARHGAQTEQHNLHCTLVADLLLSAGGSLPKSYQHVLNLARTLDDCVQEGNASDDTLEKLQTTLKLIFQPDMDEDSEKKPAAEENVEEEEEEVATGKSMKRQLNRLITAALNAMKKADPQNLFLNPVTDAIAPGYSKVISRPICIVEMEEKVRKNEYATISSWEADVKLMFKNCIDYNRGSTGSWFRGEAKRQGNVFKEEILPQAKKLFQQEIAKRKDDSRKRKAEEPVQGGVKPLPPSSKKRKKDKEEFLPSMPALASMLLADPFVVRIMSARILRELRRGVLGGTSLPAAHSVIPSLLQILHLSSWSLQLCAIRGKRYFVPDCGLGPKPGDDPASRVPYASLRKFIPLLLRFLLEAEMDKRISEGGDLYQAAQSTDLKPKPVDVESWKRGDDNVDVVLMLVQGAVVQVCQSGTGNDASLAITFPKFARALQSLSSLSLWHQRAFFHCLVTAIVKHKAKLTKGARDAIVQSWLEWLQPQEGRETKEGSMTSAAHEYLITLLNDWSAFGNLLLTRDKLMEFASSAVEAANATEGRKRQFCKMWDRKDDEDFVPIRKQYERMLQHLPVTSAQEWKAKVGIEEEEGGEEVTKSPSSN